MSGKLKRSSAGIGLGSAFDGIMTGQNSGMMYENSPLEAYQFQAAEVVKIDLAPEAVENTGRVAFRYITELGKDDSQLNWAYPANSTIRVYPVLHELVLVFNVLGKNFWMPAVNYNNYMNNNYIKSIATLKAKKESDKSQEYKETMASGIPNSSNEKTSGLGDEFQDNRVKIGILTPKEGDSIIEGRFGNSIRIGHNTETNSPNIKMSLKDYEEYVSAEESLDLDSSIWMTTDEVLYFNPFSPSINEKNSPPSEYNGKQIFIMSDRIVFGSKLNELLFFSNKTISFSSNDNFSVDTAKKIMINSDDDIDATAKKQVFVRADENINTNTKKQILLTAEQEFKLQAMKTMIGSFNANEPLVLGNKWKDMMITLIDILLEHTHATGTGPTGPILPPHYAKLSNIKSSIQRKDHISDDNFTTKKNK